MSPSLEERLGRVAAVAFDVDGVLTDGGLFYGPGGEALKRFDVKDGHAMVLARLTGLKVAILTARVSSIVEVRAGELKLAAVLQGKRDKGQAFEELCQSLGVPAEAIAFMGDDLNDLPPMGKAGLAACPADAVDEVRAAAHFVASRPGGHGAARELIERVLKATGRWEEALRHTGSAPATGR